MFLFKVEQVFVITERGLVLTPGLGNQTIAIGSKIKLVRPDKSTLDTIITGVTYGEERDVLIGKDIKKEDVPIGTEVWLNE